MSRPLAEAPARCLAAPTSEEHELFARISTEFHEMPGLRLTLPQAARLFSIEPTICQQVLNGLVRDGHLAVDGPAFINVDVVESMKASR